METSNNGRTVVRIDGGRIRTLREGKGLTQLYVATVVGVTTDTVSRWENRRYQTVKRANALKLAEALEVPLEEILDQPPAEEAPAANQEAEPHTTTGAGDRPPSPPPEQPARRMAMTQPVKAFLAVLIAMAILAAIRLIPPATKVTARRWLPDHTPPGAVFPVRITVTGPTNGPVSLIVREEIPANLQVVGGTPGLKTTEDHAVRWLRKTTLPAVFVYLCRPAGDLELGAALSLSGTITQKDHRAGAVTGRQSITLAPYHWADTNRDHLIDDDEVLAVYDAFGDLEGQGLDLGMVEDIWAAGGYRWDPAGNTFLPLP